MTHDRFTSLPRSELAATIYRALDDRVETIFGDEISAIEQNESSIRICFHQAASGDFDVVIGADGLHSQVRVLAFGPQSQFEKPLGYYAAAFQVYGISAARRTRLRLLHDPGPRSCAIRSSATTRRYSCSCSSMNCAPISILNRAAAPRTFCAASSPTTAGSARESSPRWIGPANLFGPRSQIFGWTVVAGPGDADRRCGGLHFRLSGGEARAWR